MKWLINKGGKREIGVNVIYLSQVNDFRDVLHLRNLHVSKDNTFTWHNKNEGMTNIQT